MLVLAILYFIIPYDLLPDSLGRIGRVDDIVLLLIIVWWNFFKPLYDEVFKRHAARFSSNTKANPTVESRIDQAHEILGVDSNASLEDIKKAYYQLVKQYHPDLVDNLGPELKMLARTRTTQINEAYEYLCRQRGQS